MRYEEICHEMKSNGWEAHLTLCFKHITNPDFDRKGKGFCTVGNVRQLETHRLYAEMGTPPDTSNWVGEPVTFAVYEPCSGGATTRRTLKGWVYRDRGIFAYQHPGGGIVHAALSDVEHRLPLAKTT